MTRRTRRPTRHRRARRPVEPASPELEKHLHALAGILDDAAEMEGWGAPPQLLYAAPVAATPDDFELGTKRLEGGMGVVEALCGFLAPAYWHVLGVLTEGNAFHTNEEGTRKVGSAGRARIVHLVHRSGVAASIIRSQDEGPILSPEAPIGRVDDYLRRALAIPASPPEVTTLELWATVWLDHVLAREPVTWPDAIGLHPAVEAVRKTPDLPLEIDAERDLVRVGRAFANVMSWEQLRTDCATGHWHANEVPPHLAAWLDEGSFSREILGGWPPMLELADAATQMLPVPVANGITEALDAWELL
jgi:hypothetical protein